MDFKRYINEASKQSPEMLRAKIVKWLKKKHKIKDAVYLDEDFESDKVFYYNEEIQVHVNTTMYDKPVFDIEYV